MHSLCNTFNPDAQLRIGFKGKVNQFYTFIIIGELFYLMILLVVLYLQWFN